MRAHNSTIKIKEKVCKSCGKRCIWFSRGRCQECARIEDTLAKDSKAEVVFEDLSGLIQDADALVSRFVRLSAASQDSGLVRCYTCPEIQFWKNMDAGHYITRACLFLRHDLRNIRPQCQDCNRFNSGRPAQFSIHLEREQPGLVEELIHESRIIHHVTREELRAVISDMTTKLSKFKT